MEADSVPSRRRILRGQQTSHDMPTRGSRGQHRSAPQSSSTITTITTITITATTNPSKQQAPPPTCLLR